MAAAVRPAIAPEVKMDAVRQPATFSRDHVARLVRACLHRELLAAVLKHLRHERKAGEPSVLIESGENLFAASHFDEVTDIELAVTHVL